MFWDGMGVALWGKSLKSLGVQISVVDFKFVKPWKLTWNQKIT